MGARSTDELKSSRMRSTIEQLVADFWDLVRKAGFTP